jgi:hypothetical protein
MVVTAFQCALASLLPLPSIFISTTSKHIQTSEISHNNISQLGRWCSWFSLFRFQRDAPMREFAAGRQKQIPRQANLLGKERTLLGQEFLQRGPRSELSLG